MRRWIQTTRRCGFTLIEVLVVIGVEAGGGDFTTEADVSAAFGGPAAIGELFLTDHLLAFEITSIVLLAAAVGGVVLGSQAHDDQPKTPSNTVLQGGTRAE